MTREEAKSCISTIEMLQRLAYNIHGVMDVIDSDNCKKIIKALEQEPSGDLISRQEVIDACEQSINILEAVDRIMDLPSVEQEPKTGWNNHQIACMLADLFGDTCACNYNDIDEWLSELCDFKDTCCPHPVGVACWEQFLKYSQSRYTECGYEVRDKGALQEPKESEDKV